MDSNLLLEQYSRYEKLALEKSPYKCLLSADIELNPHQINAFCAAVQSLRTGGIILADEVGLGKTIEAGLVLNYVLDSGAKRILIVLPAMLRKQWEMEMEEKFHLPVTILDRNSVEKDFYATKAWIENPSETRIIVVSYDYASKLMKRFPDVKWDFLIIDEAHNLRNVFHGTKRAKKLYDLSRGIPKILLTATPLQNSLSDLHGLVSFIDPRIFGPEKVFNRRFVEGADYTELKNELSPVLYRTLRRDVSKYMDFRKRECITVDFHLTQEESHLYELVNSFLKRDVLYSISVANRGLIILVIRKLLASSSFALTETFEVLENRLEKLYQGTKSANAQEGFDLFWAFVEDEMDEDDFEEPENEDEQLKKQEILEELELVREIKETAGSITENAKISALKTALSTAFEQQKEKGIPEKAVVFTESKRTQKYIARELRESGYSEEDILLFSGDYDDEMTKEIYRAWQVKNYGKTQYGRGVEYKHAIVDYFTDHAKILIVTDAGSEGLNLQFCNTVINYDLPWNPQKIEQRIGRCHRYGQKNDVVAVNLLNTDNEADKRVYEILRQKFELFDGVFGASDAALGALEPGSSFEKTVLEIYQKCDSRAEFSREFDKLDKQLDLKLNKRAHQLSTLLLSESPGAKEDALDQTKADIDTYLKAVNFWNQFAEPEVDGSLNYWRIDGWGEENFGGHGTLFIGAFCNNGEILFPVLLVCDQSGHEIPIEKTELVRLLMKADDDCIHYFTPSGDEMVFYGEVYDRLTREMTEQYQRSVAPVVEYNRMKLNNWVDIQKEQLYEQIYGLDTEIENLLLQESMARDTLEKSDILKKVDEKKKQLEKLQNSRPEKIANMEAGAVMDAAKFEKELEINPFLAINIVLKF